LTAHCLDTLDVEMLVVEHGIYDNRRKGLQPWPFFFVVILQSILSELLFKLLKALYFGEGLLGLTLKEFQITR